MIQICTFKINHSNGGHDLNRVVLTVFNSCAKKQLSKAVTTVFHMTFNVSSWLCNKCVIARVLTYSSSRVSV